ncbi:MAG: NUDIX hydrolase [Nitrosopumilaceae archaeon]|uniref:NUDIX hydrolase n=1 Tax=Candidatus Nitrosomaritimum aestuariumsis TaxID=3342354 RepID=A0AC60VWP1_9ARCH|nr:NUDIX hydrolase [Nitrosopumilaceae archaeon]
MKKKKIYEGKILGLSVYDGIIEGRKVKREMIEHRGAAAMLAFDEDNKVILVKQHRFPHGFVLEIPAGTLEKGEEPLKCAFRELEEETGYRAKKMTPLITYYPSIGYNTEAIHCFVATGLKKIADLSLDEDEILSVVKISMKRLIGMIKSGKIQDSKTICAVLTYAAKKKLF